MLTLPEERVEIACVERQLGQIKQTHPRKRVLRPAPHGIPAGAPSDTGGPKQQPSIFSLAGGTDGLPGWLVRHWRTPHGEYGTEWDRASQVRTAIETFRRTRAR
ncbi:hypothetical protein GCM10010313_29210 [Streptomyces violarus]|nr:hypothetical protein GCM10010313_29210 [Streptomyces violarus]